MWGGVEEICQCNGRRTRGDGGGIGWAREAGSARIRTLRKGDPSVFITILLVVVIAKLQILGVTWYERARILVKNEIIPWLSPPAWGCAVCDAFEYVSHGSNMI